MFGIPMLSSDRSEELPRRPNNHALRVPGPRLRALGFIVLVLTTTAYGIAMMFDILRANGTTLLEGSILILFAVAFAWIAAAFWTAMVGFILRLFQLDPLTLRWRRAPRFGEIPIVTRTAVVMPVYNEHTARVIAGVEATCESLAATGEADKFDFYLLSDSTDPAVAMQEEAAWAALQQRLTGVFRGQLFYRRRSSNTGRKPGNIADFCRRWGAYYEFMIVLDADSVMTGTAMTSLVRAMQADPQAGLIQTVPIPVRQQTMFGRFVQFASEIYSPMLATGLSFWQTGTANYWGHNAIIRVQAFTEQCGLPVLPGEPPFGGEILSHDFVEAALLRRSGWQVYLFPELQGSYEEVPDNILDFVKRDRRWAQGNLQHLKLLTAPGLRPLSRLNFLLGATAYLSSLLWLVMLVLSSADAIEQALTGTQFFGPGYQLFPNWPIVKTDEIVSLVSITIGMLLLPKTLGIVLCLLQPHARQTFGGTTRLLRSALIETTFSILIAPIMMIYHAYFVVSILLGQPISWGPQERMGRRVTLTEALRYTFAVTLGGLVWGGAAWVLAPQFFWWLLPVLTGLLIAAPLVCLSSSPALGKALRRCGVFLAPSETEPPQVLQRLQQLIMTRQESTPLPDWTPYLPPVRYREMPIQRLTRQRRARDRSTTTYGQYWIRRRID
ncbi:MAG: glucans biosynthesis glucosyltransferase MdoH [Nitrococcus mobilis]|nr:glucans biosynthesis glucosyltransferase MdoH [Nitrococcus mobilis]